MLTLDFSLIYHDDSFFALSSAAFTKMITINGQEYHLQLVDTAGQVCVGPLLPLTLLLLRNGIGARVSLKNHFNLGC